MPNSVSERPLKKLAVNNQRPEGTSTCYGSNSILSLPRQGLVELMQRLHICSIPNLGVQGGEPKFYCSTKVARMIRIGTDGSAHPVFEGQYLLLRSEVVTLFDLFTEIQDGVIEMLEIKHGLPFRIVVVESM